MTSAYPSRALSKLNASRLGRHPVAVQEAGPGRHTSGGVLPRAELAAEGRRGGARRAGGPGWHNGAEVRPKAIELDPLHPVTDEELLRGQGPSDTAGRHAGRGDLRGARPPWARFVTAGLFVRRTRLLQEGAFHGPEVLPLPAQAARGRGGDAARRGPAGPPRGSGPGGLATVAAAGDGLFQRGSRRNARCRPGPNRYTRKWASKAKASWMPSLSMRANVVQSTKLNG